jgi:hypothetical protein
MAERVIITLPNGRPQTVKQTKQEFELDGFRMTSYLAVNLTSGLASATSDARLSLARVLPVSSAREISRS